MELHNLEPAEGSLKSSKRIGRGQGSGRGGTSTRGHKGAQSRSGYSRKLGFEGGQMPLVRRVPKFGFKNPGRVEYHCINLDVIQQLVEELNLNAIDVNTLIEHGLASKRQLVKVLGRGVLNRKIDVTAHAFSASALKSIESNGGVATKI